MDTGPISQKTVVRRLGADAQLEHLVGYKDGVGEWSRDKSGAITFDTREEAVPVCESLGGIGFHAFPRVLGSGEMQPPPLPPAKRPEPQHGRSVVEIERDHRLEEYEARLRRQHLD